jgi:hypothetical protein
MSFEATPYVAVYVVKLSIESAATATTKLDHSSSVWYRVRHLDLA